jgi:hypothetical protein
MASKIRELTYAERLDYAVVLPDQFIRRPNSQTGPRALMVAVLADAWRSVYGVQAAFPRDASRRSLVRETLDWFFTPSTGWPFDFEIICDHLDLSADAFREVLRRQHDRSVRIIEASKLKKFRRIARGDLVLDKLARRA